MPKVNVHVCVNVRVNVYLCLIIQNTSVYVLSSGGVF